MNHKSKKFFLVLGLALTLRVGAITAFAQTNQNPQSVSYVPLIGITSVPEPFALPNGAGEVIYNYAVKNFLQESALSRIQVTDDKCGPIKFIEGDDNGNGQLDSSETWRYTCTTKLSVTTQSIATVTGTAYGLTATHKAYSTVVVGSNDPYPLVSIVNITKVAYPLSLPTEGGSITFTYRVNNPGVVPLSDVVVSDDKCGDMSGKLGDTNDNNLLDLNEVWVYTCTTNVQETTTNTATVTALARSYKAVSYATLTVMVDAPAGENSPKLPDVGANPNIKITTWKILGGVLLALVLFFVFIHTNKLKNKNL